jgi:aspartate/methionine/tyrosine aminotransferase
MADFKNLTLYESRALMAVFNLADAHTHQGQSISQEAIIDRLPSLFREAESTTQSELNQRVYDAYHSLNRQFTAKTLGEPLICYSASIAMEIVANYLRQHQLSVSLIEPTFDNIPDILKRHGIRLSPLSDSLLLSDCFPTALQDITTDAVFLTLPNNPTGTFLPKEKFQAFVDICVDRHIFIIIDTCFRLYVPEFLYDQYQILEDAKASYIIIEDTGKVWPTLDLKISFLNTSRDVRAEIVRIHSDFLLNVSPFILRLLLEYIEDSKMDNFESIFGLIKQNRTFLRTQIAGSILIPTYNSSSISVEFLKISEGLSATELQYLLSLNGVYILSGNKFYWHHENQGSSFIRIALARDPSMFKNAIITMAAVLAQSPNNFG